MAHLVGRASVPKPSQVLLSGLQLSPSAAKSVPYGLAPGLPRLCALGLFLALHRRLGTESPYAAYIASLPTEGPSSFLLEDDEIERRLAAAGPIGSAMAPSSKQAARCSSDPTLSSLVFFASIPPRAPPHRATRGVLRGVFAAVSESVRQGGVSEADFLWGVSMAASRPLGGALVPFVDLMNHRRDTGALGIKLRDPSRGAVTEEDDYVYQARGKALAAGQVCTRWRPRVCWLGPDPTRSAWPCAARQDLSPLFTALLLQPTRVQEACLDYDAGRMLAEGSELEHFPQVWFLQHGFLDPDYLVSRNGVPCFTRPRFWDLLPNTAGKEEKKLHRLLVAASESTVDALLQGRGAGPASGSKPTGFGASKAASPKKK